MADQLLANRAVGGPSAFETLCNCVLTHAGFFGPLSNVHRSTVCGYEQLSGRLAALALIAVLFLGRGPSHVSWFIMAIVVLSIERVSTGWTVANFSKELFKRIEPELNPAPTVGLPILGVGIRTAMLRLMVRRVFGGLVHPMRSARFAANLPKLAPQAPTRFRPTAGEQLGANSSHGPTLALAYPTRPQPRTGSADNFPSSELMTFEV